MAIALHEALQQLHEKIDRLTEKVEEMNPERQRKIDKTIFAAAPDGSPEVSRERLAKRLVEYDEAAEMLSISTSTLKRLIARGDIRKSMVLGKALISVAEIDRFVRSLEEIAAAVKSCADPAPSHAPKVDPDIKAAADRIRALTKKR